VSAEAERAIAPDRQSGAPEESDLWRKWKEARSLEARERLFVLYSPLALRIARRCFRRWRGDFADVRQLANLGLIEAIDAFDPARLTPFGAYASRRIRGAVFDGLMKMSELNEQVAARRRARRERLVSLGGPDPDAGSSTRETLKRLVELAIGLALGFMLEGTRLYAQNEEFPDVYEQVAWRELISRLKAEVAALPHRERTILQHHYDGVLTFEQIGDLLGISRARVSQIHKAALATLRERLSRREGLKPGLTGE
jgi:RNA polymerase sigma factor for flagellar operon FliA